MRKYFLKENKNMLQKFFEHDWISFNSFPIETIVLLVFFAFL